MDDGSGDVSIDEFIAVCEQVSAWAVLSGQCLRALETPASGQCLSGALLPLAAETFCRLLVIWGSVLQAQAPPGQGQHFQEPKP